MSRSIVCLVIIFVLQACFVSRTESPRLIGYVFDAHTKQAIKGCIIGEMQTDTNGFY